MTERQPIDELAEQGAPAAALLNPDIVEPPAPEQPAQTPEPAPEQPVPTPEPAPEQAQPEQPTWQPGMPLAWRTTDEQDAARTTSIDAKISTEFRKQFRERPDLWDTAGLDRDAANERNVHAHLAAAIKAGGVADDPSKWRPYTDLARQKVLQQYGYYDLPNNAQGRQTKQRMLAEVNSHLSTFNATPDILGVPAKPAEQAPNTLDTYLTGRLGVTPAIRQKLVEDPLFREDMAKTYKGLISRDNKLDAASKANLIAELRLFQDSGELGTPTQPAQAATEAPAEAPTPGESETVKRLRAMPWYQRELEDFRAKIVDPVLINGTNTLLKGGAFVTTAIAGENPVGRWLSKDAVDFLNSGKSETTLEFERQVADYWQKNKDNPLGDAGILLQSMFERPELGFGSVYSMLAESAGTGFGVGAGLKAGAKLSAGVAAATAGGTVTAAQAAADTQETINTVREASPDQIKETLGFQAWLKDPVNAQIYAEAPAAAIEAYRDNKVKDLIAVGAVTTAAAGALGTIGMGSIGPSSLVKVPVAQGAAEAIGGIPAAAATVPVANAVLSGQTAGNFLLGAAIDAPGTAVGVALGTRDTPAQTPAPDTPAPPDTPETPAQTTPASAAPVNLQEALAKAQQLYEQQLELPLQATEPAASDQLDLFKDLTLPFKDRQLTPVQQQIVDRMGIDPRPFSDDPEIVEQYRQDVATAQQEIAGDPQKQKLLDAGFVPAAVAAYPAPVQRGTVSTDFSNDAMAGYLAASADPTALAEFKNAIVEAVGETTPKPEAQAAPEATPETPPVAVTDLLPDDVTPAETEALGIDPRPDSNDPVQVQQYAADVATARQETAGDADAQALLDGGFIPSAVASGRRTPLMESYLAASNNPARAQAIKDQISTPPAGQAQPSDIARRASEMLAAGRPVPVSMFLPKTVPTQRLAELGLDTRPFSNKPALMQQYSEERADAVKRSLVKDKRALIEAGFDKANASEDSSNPVVQEYLTALRTGDFVSFKAYIDGLLGPEPRGGINLVRPFNNLPYQEALRLSTQAVADAVSSPAINEIVKNNNLKVNIEYLPIDAKQAYSMLINVRAGKLNVKINPSRVDFEAFQTEFTGKVRLAVLTDKVNKFGDLQAALDRMFNAVVATSEGQRVFKDVKQLYEENGDDGSYISNREDNRATPQFVNSVLAEYLGRVGTPPTQINSVWQRIQNTFGTLFDSEFTMADLFEAVNDSDRGVLSETLKDLADTTGDRYKFVAQMPGTPVNGASLAKNNWLNWMHSPVWTSIGARRVLVRQLNNPIANDASRVLDGLRGLYNAELAASSAKFKRIHEIVAEIARRDGSSIEDVRAQTGRALNAMDALERVETLHLWQAKLNKEGQAQRAKLIKDFNREIAESVGPNGLSSEQRFLLGQTYKTKLQDIVKQYAVKSSTIEKTFNGSVSNNGLNGFADMAQARDAAALLANAAPGSAEARLLETVKELNAVMNDGAKRSGRISEIALGFWNRTIYVPQFTDTRAFEAAQNEWSDFDILGPTPKDRRASLVNSFQEATRGSNQYQNDPYGALDAMSRRIARYVTDNVKAEQFIKLQAITSKNPVFKNTITDPALQPPIQVDENGFVDPLASEDVREKFRDNDLMFVAPNGERRTITVKVTEWLGDIKMDGLAGKFVRSGVGAGAQRFTGSLARLHTVFNPMHQLVDPIRTGAEAFWAVYGDKGIKASFLQQFYMFGSAPVSGKITAMDVGQRKAWAQANINSTNKFERYAAERILANNWISQSAAYRVFTNRQVGLLGGNTLTQPIAEKLNTATEGLEWWMDTVDNTIRLSMYTALREFGDDVNTAARLTRDFMNWDNRSQMGQVANAFYFFGNSSNLGFLKVVGADTWKDRAPPISYKTNPNGQIEMKVDWASIPSSLDKFKLVSMVMYGFGIQMLNQAICPDEAGAISPANLMKNLVVPGGCFIGIPAPTRPLQHGVERLFVGGGQLLAGIASGYVDGQEAAKAWTESALSLAPVPAGSLVKFGDGPANQYPQLDVMARNAFPSVFQPFVEIGMNTRHNGTALYLPERPGQYFSENGMVETHPFFKELAKYARKWTGIDQPPEVYQTLMGQFGGVSAAAQTLTGALEGDIESVKRGIMGSNYFEVDIEAAVANRDGGKAKKLLAHIRAELQAARNADRALYAKQGADLGNRKGPYERAYLAKPGVAAFLKQSNRLRDRTSKEKKQAALVRDIDRMKAAAKRQNQELSRLVKEFEAAKQRAETAKPSSPSGQ